MLGNLGDQIPQQLSKYLKGLDFPADKDDVVRQAEANEANTMVVSALKKIPPGVYNSVNDIAEKANVSDLMGKR